MINYNDNDNNDNNNDNDDQSFSHNIITASAEFFGTADTKAKEKEDILSLFRTPAVTFSYF